MAAAVVAGLLCWIPAPAWAEEIACGELPEERELTDGESRPFGELRARDAQQQATGEGVTVALVDAAVTTRNELLPDVEPIQVAGAGELVDSPTFAAGLIAGGVPDNQDAPLGIAPGARLLSVRVYDGPGTTDDDEDATPLRADNLADGIDAAREAGADVVAVSAALFDDDDEVRGAVRRAVRDGIVVVAAVGQRPEDEQPGFGDYGTPRLNEDVQTYPAAYPDVLGVGTGSADGGYDPDAAFASRHIDVVAPVLGAETTSLNGSTCLVDFSTTDLAAAQVAGLAALVLERFGPDYTARQVQARIQETASGATDDRSPTDGFGVVQANEALTRQLVIREDGQVVRARQPADRTPAIPPPDPVEDPFVALRGSMLWWAVLAGGGLVLALLLRPLLRRTTG